MRTVHEREPRVEVSRTLQFLMGSRSGFYVCLLRLFRAWSVFVRKKRNNNDSIFSNVGVSLDTTRTVKEKHV